MKLVTLNGSITVQDGMDSDGTGIESTSTGDVLLESRSAGSDIVANAGIVSRGGHISLIAADSIDTMDDVKTLGAGTILIDALAGSVRIADGNDTDLDGVSTDGGDILIRAASTMTIDGEVNSQSGDIGLLAQGNIKLNSDIATVAGDILISAVGNIDMGLGTSTSSNQQLILSSRNGSITLGLLNGAHVAVTAQLDILDGNGADALNVIATELSLRSTTGSIGRPAPPTSDNTNPNAIDTRVATLAGQAASGIYLQELDDLTIDHVQSVTVAVDNIQQVHFRSSPTSLVTASQSVASLDDLKSSTEIKLSTLNGSILVQDGLNSDGVGIQSTSNGNILLQASNNSAFTTSDIRLNTAILSEGGISV